MESIAAEAAPTGVVQAAWPAPASVRAFTTLRTGPGVSPTPFDRFNFGLRSGDDPANALENRSILRQSLGLPSEPRWLNQVHGTDVFQAGASASFARAEAGEPIADASVTSEANVVLAILTADCLPVLFCNDDGTEVAAAHAGWGGLSAGMLEATVCAMASPASSLMAWIGPAAGPQVYEIGAEVREAFLSRDLQAASAFVPTRPGHWRVDLFALARQRLASVGVHRVHGGGICTISDPDSFYSYRRDGRTGRMASVIWFGS